MIRKTKIFSVLLSIATLASSFLLPISDIIETTQAATTEYDFEVNELNLQPSYELNQGELSIPISLTNIGTQDWEPVDISGNPLIQLTYQMSSSVGIITDLVSEVNSLSSAPDNATDATQVLHVEIPDNPGVYELEIFLFDNSNDTNPYIPASNPLVFNFEVTEILNEDSTPPIGSISINNNTSTTTNPEIIIDLTATDPKTEGEKVAGVTEFIISKQEDFTDSSWEVWMGDGSQLTGEIDAIPGEYSFYVQFKDGVGNTSEVYSDSIEFVSSKPVGTLEIDANTKVEVEGKLEAQDTTLDLLIEGTSNTNITEYILSEDVNFLDTEWVQIENLDTEVSFVVSQEIPDETGTYEFFVKLKNEFGDESEIFHNSVAYTSYNVSPTLSVEADDVLYGGEMVFKATIKNTGEDIGYNAGLDVTLPKGFEFNSSKVCRFDYVNSNCNFKELVDGGLEPTFISTNADGLQVISYQGLNDLLPGEETSVYAALSVGGLAEGYKLGDIVSIPFTSTLYNRNNFAVGNEVTSELNVELLPYIVHLETGNSSNNDYLIGETIENSITIQANPDIASDEPITVNETVDPTPEDPDNEDTEEIEYQLNPFEIEYDLGSGIEFVEDSMEVINYIGEPETILFGATNIVGINTTLTWTLINSIGTEYYETPLQLLFDTVIPKYNENEDRYTEHKETIESNLNTTGRYTQPGLNEEDEPFLSKAYLDSEKSSINANYFAINKRSENITPPAESSNSGDIIRYYIQIDTSNEYNLTGIEITDVLPDGITYTGNIAYSEDLSLNLFEQVVDPSTGLTTLIWRISDESGISAGSSFEFSYDAEIQANYISKQLDDGDSRLFSDDSLNSPAEIRGVWSDVDLDVNTGDPRSGIETDIDSTQIQIDPVDFESGVKHTYETEFNKSVHTKIGDIVDVFGSVTFPVSNPTNDFVYYLYLPVGTELFGDITIAQEGSFETTPIATPITNGFVIQTGKVEPGSSLRINYQLEVLDDTNLKIATQVSNLFRSNYTNIDDTKLTYRDDVSLILIEPNLNATKKVTNGYLARGEQATIETLITNEGTDSAYEFTVVDNLPINTSLINEENVVCNLLDENTIVLVGIDCEFIGDEISVYVDELLGNQSIQVNYEILVDNNVLYNDLLNSSIFIDEHSNRASDDPLIARNYEGKEFNFNWRAKEPLLETSIEITNSNVVDETTFEVGRDYQFEINSNVQTVGGSPIYNTDITFAIVDSSVFNYNFEIVRASILLNGTIDTDLTNSLEINGLSYSLSGLDLNRNDLITLQLEVNSFDYARFGDKISIQVQAEGFDALNEQIRKNGCEGVIDCTIDNDEDDTSEAILTIGLVDTTPPVGEIYFLNNGNYSEFINLDEIDVEYLASDPVNSVAISSEIVGIRFSTDGENWKITETLNELTNSEKQLYLLNETNSWNSWDGTNLILEDQLVELEGINWFYMEVVDNYGNSSVISNKIVKDTTGPNNAFVFLSPVENDLSNVSQTSETNNFINFYADDPALDSLGEELDITDYSGIGEYSYCIPLNTECFINTNDVLEVHQQNWSGWNEMSDGINSFSYDFRGISDEEHIVVYMIIRDRSGNEFENISSIEDPITELQLPENVIYDDILFNIVGGSSNNTTSPRISITLNNDEAFTNDSKVLVSVNVLNNGNGLDEIKLGTNETEVSESNFWTDFFGNSFEWVLDNPQLDGEKEICVKIRDYRNRESNIACDSILLDNSAPIGFIVINEGDAVTTERNVTLNIAASDPNLSDGNQGIWDLQMRLSTSGENCELFLLEEKLPCEENWLPWQAYDSGIPWELDDYIGTHNVFIQFKDGLDNISDVTSAQVTYNPLQSLSGKIVINNDDTFTNTRNVVLTLPLEEGDTNPILMRFYQTNDNNTPPAPLFVTNPDQDSNGWTYWQEYYDNVQWSLDWDETTAADESFGKKNICVQFKYPDTTESDVLCDSIIYAPFYAVDYFRYNSEDDFLDINTKTYGLRQIPTNALSQDTFTIRLNPRNIGSFTWPSDGANPVRISYKWNRIAGELPPGWTENMILDEYRGNSVSLNEITPWNNDTGQLSLQVTTPLLPGQYELIIDTIHEGQAWFGDYGNETPTYTIEIDQNPSKDIPQPEFSILGENSDGIGGPISIPYNWDNYDGNRDGWGANCEDTWGANRYSGRTCFVQGTWQAPRNTDYQAVCRNYGGYYKYEMATSAGRVFFFCPRDDAYWDQFMGQQMTSEVYWYRPWENSGYGGFSIRQTAPTRKTWDSRFNSNQNDSRLSQTIITNRSNAADGRTISFTIQPRLLNAGTKIWNQGNIDLVAIDRPLNQGGKETHSQFYDSSTWKNRSRIEVNYNHSGYGNNTLAPFTFNIDVPETVSFGTHRQCFVMTNSPYERWERRDSFCLTIEVQRTEQEKRQFFCSQSHPVFEEKDFNSTQIGEITENTSFVIQYSEEGPEDPDTGENSWSYIYYPEDGQKGWVLDDLDCFGDAEIIENIIEVPEFEVIPDPTGDSGYVINLDGINVHMGPGELFDIIQTIPYGAHVQVLKEAYIEDNQYGGWLYVRLDPEDCTTDLAKAQNCEGWVPKGTISHVNDPVDVVIAPRPEYYRGHVCGTENINVYRYPGVKNEVIDTLVPGLNVSILTSWYPPIEGAAPWFLVYLNQQGDTGWIESFDGLCDGFTLPAGDPFCAGDLGYPYERDYGISANGHYGAQRKTSVHYAIDIPAPYGSDVLAVEHGYVVKVSFNGGCGLGSDSPNSMYGGGIYVDIYHPKQNVTSRSLHLKSVNPQLLRSFQNGGNPEVFKGMVIGQTGNTGCVYPMPSPSNPLGGTHLHFEVFTPNGARLNPQNFWQGGSCPANIEGDDAAKAQSLIKEKEAEWDEFVPMDDWRGLVHKWSDTCDVYVKDYAVIKDSSEGIDITPQDWMGGHSSAVLIFNPKAFGGKGEVFLVQGGIWQEYIEAGGPCDVLGLPIYTNGSTTENIAGVSTTSESNGVEKATARYQRFEDGAIYWHWNQTQGRAYSHAVHGEIYDIYEAAGGTWSSYGFPVSDVTDGCQHFERGSICDSAEANCRLSDRGQYPIKIDGKVWDYYYDNGGCERFGVPIEGLKHLGNSDFNYAYHNGESWGQSFQIANIYTYERVTNILGDRTVYTYHLEGCFKEAYESSILEADGLSLDAAREYLGMPTENARYYSSFTVTEDKTLYGVDAQAFRNGHIVEEDDNCNVVLNEEGNNKLKDDIFGAGPSFGEIIQSFTSGVIQGAKDAISIDNWSDVLDLALEIGAIIFGGWIGALINVIELVVAIVQIIQAVLEVGSDLLELVQNATPDILYYLGGLILGGVVVAVTIGNVGDLVKSVKKSITNLGGIGKTVADLRKLDVEIPDNFNKLFNSFTENIDNTEDAIEAVNLLKKNPLIFGKVTGELDQVDPSDLRKIFERVDRTGDNLNVDKFLSSKSKHGLQNVDEYFRILNLSDKYNIPSDRLMHVLKPDYENPRSGLHVWDEAQNFKKNNDNFRIEVIESPTETTPGSANIFTKNIPTPIYKTYFPQSWSPEDIAAAGNKLKQDGYKIPPADANDSNNTFETLFNKDNRTYIIRGFIDTNTGNLISWFPHIQ